MDLSSGKTSVEEHGGTGDSHVADPFLALIVPMVDTDPAIRHSLQRVSPLTWPRHGQTRFHGKPPAISSSLTEPALSRLFYPAADCSLMLHVYSRTTSLQPGYTNSVYLSVPRSHVRFREKRLSRREEKVVFFQEGEFQVSRFSPLPLKVIGKRRNEGRKKNERCTREREKERVLEGKM